MKTIYKEEFVQENVKDNRNSDSTAYSAEEDREDV